MTNPSLRRTDENLQKRVKALERRARKAKRAEEALKIQNAYLELLFESAPDAILLADKAHRITRINSQFSKMFGYTLEEAIGRTADELIAGKDMREEAAQITRQVGRGETIRMEGIRYRKNDTPVHVDLMAAPVLSGKEQIATYASYRDITRRKRMEAAIRKSEEQYRTLIENIPVGVYRCTPGPHGRFLMANPTFLRMFGFTSEQELRKIRVSDIYMDPSQRKGFSHALLRDKSILASDRLLKKKDGTPLWAVVSARVAHHLLSARVSHFDCVIVDITEKKLAEQALKESHSTLLTVLDSIDATIYVADLKTYEILFANKCMRNVFGRDLVGEVCWKAFREGSEPCPHCTNSQLVDAEGQPTGVRVWEGENPISGRWYVNYDRAIKWADGRIVRLQVAMDITKIKEAEIALKREKGYLDALHETALEIVSRLEAEEVLHAIVQRAARLVGTPHGYVYLYDQPAGELVLRVGIGAYKDMVGMHLKPEEGGPGRVFQSAETLVIDDYRSWPERSQDRRFDELSAVIGLPLRSDRQVSGVIGVGYFGESRKFDPAEITVLSRFAAIASIALDNALLYSNLKKELEEHKRAEEERQKLETQLHLAQRMHAIGTLAGGIAHDFNNILMGIQGRTSLMLLEAASSHPHFEHLKGI
ncbi:MAG: PAS domain S-box protein, partial [Deltaproteobacteria bacterium]